jgi:protein involved in polysaccharide export with SLBB domain
MRFARGRGALTIAVIVAASLLATSSVRAAEPEPGISVRLLGAVAKPGPYKLAAGSRLSDLFTAAGVRLPTDDPKNMPLTEIAAATGSCSVLLGDLRQVYLTRKTGDKRLYYSLPFDLARVHDDARIDPLLHDADTVFVPQCRQAGGIKQIVEPLPLTAR